MTGGTIDDILAGNPDLGTLPSVFHRVEAAVNDPTSSFEAMSRAIETDSALTAKLLRIANSSLYNFPSRINSIDRAISIIGTQQLRDLVLAATIIRYFSHLPVAGVDMDSFWRHSIVTALLARSLAGARRETNVERFYVAGLLHDIGRLLMFMHLTTPSARILARRDERQCLLFQAEQEVLGVDHAELGGDLLRAWNLPRAFEEPVRHHHSPSLASQYPIETAVVHVADSIANALRLGTSGERYVPPINDETWIRIALPENMLEQVITYTDMHYQQVVDVFMA
ncbi:HDOD domain-containing protein [Ectothiorhodospira lacustris]|uniref:HDOD domain-containing protein n=1 Tax=Ectothiorhodospira lacustris TaxID=2899127 RepID=UPI001EE9672A|nr:HDOD domain-containing protein [Ectothiorhodospira lacustris]MCG5510186.1 HDOD domain-containing protein [Ectothiorhodospira lacustris]MCG5522029.1 HDOD domain-containing protein [Ectothiorhodospira lacustris]